MTRVLIVEDEPLIAMMLEDFLEVLDHPCAGTADCVADALALIDSVAPEGAILDVNLRSGEKSWPIADALAAKGIPFVFATGGGEALPVDHNHRPQLAKPFTMDGVKKAIDALG